MKVYFITFWISASKFRAFHAPRISAMKIVLLSATGSIAFHGHHFVHLKYNLIPACFKIFQSRAFLRSAFGHFMNEN